MTTSGPSLTSTLGIVTTRSVTQTATVTATTTANSHVLQPACFFERVNTNSIVIDDQQVPLYLTAIPGGRVPSQVSRVRLGVTANSSEGLLFSSIATNEGQLAVTAQNGVVLLTNQNLTMGGALASGPIYLDDPHSLAASDRTVYQPTTFYYQLNSRFVISNTIGGASYPYLCGNTTETMQLTLANDPSAVDSSICQTVSLNFAHP